MCVFYAQKCVHNIKYLFPFDIGFKINITLCSKSTPFQMRKNFKMMQFITNRSFKKQDFSKNSILNLCKTISSQTLFY